MDPKVGTSMRQRKKTKKEGFLSPYKPIKKDKCRERNLSSATSTGGKGYLFSDSDSDDADLPRRHKSEFKKTSRKNKRIFKDKRIVSGGKRTEGKAREAVINSSSDWDFLEDDIEDDRHHQEHKSVFAPFMTKKPDGAIEWGDTFKDHSWDMHYKRKQQSTEKEPNNKGPLLSRPEKHKKHIPRFTEEKRRTLETILLRSERDATGVRKEKHQDVVKSSRQVKRATGMRKEKHQDVVKYSRQVQRATGMREEKHQDVVKSSRQVKRAKPSFFRDSESD